MRILCSPNKDFGRSNKQFGEYFRSIFPQIVAQIRYSHPLKVLRKDATDLCSVFQNLRLGSIILEVLFSGDSETTFARNSQAGLGANFTKMRPYSPACYDRMLLIYTPFMLPKRRFWTRRLMLSLMTKHSMRCYYLGFMLPNNR